MGTETEYGVWAPGCPDADPQVLSALVVDGHAGASSASSSHDRMLANGARLYVDHAHPEYATPETTSPTDATVRDLAGDDVMARAARAASEAAGFEVAVFKNNTDGKGVAYGYHENYQLSRSTPWEWVESVLPTFLVTRQVFTGAGRVGWGTWSTEPWFQLTQRADFFERVAGLDTTRNRGIVNTRDEPHALWSRYRRLHVIAGDAHRNPFATWLTLGTASLVLTALEAGGLAGVPRLASPVEAMRTVSRDLALGEPLPLVGGGSATALDLQRALLDACATTEAPEADDVRAEWSLVLDDLAADPARTSDRLDWPAKLALLNAARDRDGLDWASPRLAQLDLAWARLDDRSPHEALRRAGRLIDWIDPAAVSLATTEPPHDTRAFTRGRLIRDAPDEILHADWDGVLLRQDGQTTTVDLAEPSAWGRDTPESLGVLGRIGIRD